MHDFEVLLPLPNIDPKAKLTYPYVGSDFSQTGDMDWGKANDKKMPCANLWAWDGNIDNIIQDWEHEDN